MNNLQSKSKVLLLAAAAIVNCISGHAFLSDPLARNGGNNIRKFTPLPVSAENLNSCPGTSPGPIARTYTAGDTINVQWAITVGHSNAPGVRLALAESPDGPFIELVSGLDINDESTAVTLPAEVTCANCVLHWLWDSAGDGGYYIGCADIAITAAEAPEPVVEEESEEPEPVVEAESEEPEPVVEEEEPEEPEPVLEQEESEETVEETPVVEEEPVEEVTEEIVEEAQEVAQEAEEIAEELQEALDETTTAISPTTRAPSNAERRARRRSRRSSRRAARHAARANN